MDYPKLIVGWKEWIALPELGIPAIKAKIDTGAKTSSIHAYDIEHIKKKSKDFVRFTLHPLSRDKTITQQCELPVLDKRFIKSSSGDREKRPVIRTKIHIDGCEWDIELNLTNRDYMGFRMLIGREALEKKALINPAIGFIHGKITEQEAKSRYKQHKKKGKY